LESLARSVEFERLADALDEGRILMRRGFVDEAWELLREALETCPEESIFLDWFKHSVAELMSKGAEAAIAD
jgi:hypothetical protein